MERLEDAYQKHIQENKSTAELVKIDEEEEVDFDKMILFVGKSRVHLERHHASSVYVNFFKSMNQTNLHLMVNKIQVLNPTIYPLKIKNSNRIHILSRSIINYTSPFFLSFLPKYNLRKP